MVVWRKDSGASGLGAKEWRAQADSLGAGKG